MKKPSIKRNTKLEMLVFTFIVIAVGIVLIISIFDKPQPETAQTPSGDVQTSPQQEPPEDDRQDTEKIQPTTNPDTMVLQPEATVEVENTEIDYPDIAFPFSSDAIKNIEITCDSDWICNEDTEWQLKFGITHKLAGENVKYGYQINPSDGMIAVNYDNGVDVPSNDEAIDFYYREEYGNIIPIVGNAITWYPGDEREFESAKLFVQVINLTTKNVESVFNISIDKYGDSYKISGIESAELTGEIKEKAYDIALEYYNDRNSTAQAKGINESVVAVVPRTQNEMYFVDGMPQDGTGICPVIAVYINLRPKSGDYSNIFQGCFITYLNKDTLEVIGEGKMNFID